jgi:hypothetical protein
MCFLNKCATSFVDDRDMFEDFMYKRKMNTQCVTAGFKKGK